MRADGADDRICSTSRRARSSRSPPPRPRELARAGHGRAGAPQGGRDHQRRPPARAGGAGQRAAAADRGARAGAWSRARTCSTRSACDADADVELRRADVAAVDGGARRLPDVHAADERSAEQAARGGAGRRRRERRRAATRTARHLSLLPEVDAEGGYVRTDGQLFAPPNSVLRGRARRRGTSGSGARASSRRARRRGRPTRRRWTARTRSARSPSNQNTAAQTEAASVVVDVAHEAIASAPGGLSRDPGAGAAGSATTTDLLDSQSALPHRAPEPGARAVRARHPARGPRPRHGGIAASPFSNRRFF